MVPRTRGVVPRFARGAGEGHQAVILGPSEHLPAASLATSERGRGVPAHAHTPTLQVTHPPLASTRLLCSQGGGRCSKLLSPPLPHSRLKAPEDRAGVGLFRLQQRQLQGPAMFVLPGVGDPGGMQSSRGRCPCPTTLRAPFLLPYTCLLHPRATWGPLSTHPAVPHPICFASRAMLEEGEVWVCLLSVVSRLLAHPTPAVHHTVSDAVPTPVFWLRAALTQASLAEPSLPGSVPEEHSRVVHKEARLAPLAVQSLGAQGQGSVPAHGPPAAGDSAGFPGGTGIPWLATASGQLANGPRG